MPYSPISQDLVAALGELRQFAPYSTDPRRQRWDEAIDIVGDVQAQLSLIEKYRPGLLQRLTNEAYDESQVQSKPMIKEVRELIARYSRNR